MSSVHVVSVEFSFRLIDFVCDACLKYLLISVSQVLNAACMLNIERIECFGLTMSTYSSKIVG